MLHSEYDCLLAANFHILFKFPHKQNIPPQVGNPLPHPFTTFSATFSGTLSDFVQLIKMSNSLPEMSITANDKSGLAADEILAHSRALE